jgi:hypothetical protein
MTDDIPDQAGAEPEPTTESDVLADFARALAHAAGRLDDLDATMDDVRDGIENILQKLSHLHSMMKHQGVTLGRIAKALEEGEAEANDSGSGF